MEALAVPTVALSWEAIENKGWTHGPWVQQPWVQIFALPQGTIPLGKLANLFRMGITWTAFIIQPCHRLLCGGSEILSGNVDQRWSPPSLFWGRVSCNWVFLRLTKQWMIFSFWLPRSFFQVYYQTRYILCWGLNQGLRHSTIWVYLWSYCRHSLLSVCLSHFLPL